MGGRLKLAFRDPRLQLILRSLLFGTFLVFVKLKNFEIIPVLFFLAAAAFLYFKINVRYPNSQFFSFLVLLAVSLGATSILGQPMFLIAAILLFTVIFYLFVGIKELVFIHRQKYYFVKNILLLYSLFILFFLSEKSSYFFLKYLLVFAGIFFIFREWFSGLESYFPRRHLLASLILSFVTAEILWAVAILPIGFINSANIMLLTIYILFDFTFHHFQGTLTKKIIFKNLITFILLLFFILATSRWIVG